MKFEELQKKVLQKDEGFLIVKLMNNDFAFMIYKKNRTSLNSILKKIREEMNEYVFLYNQSKKIEDYSKKIEDYNLEYYIESHIDYSSLDSSKYKKNKTLFVKTLTGKTLIINYSPEMRVIELKQLIQDKEGCPPDQQSLVYKRIELKPFDKLEKYNLKNEATINLILNLRGGMLDTVSGRNGAFSNADFNIIKVDPDIEMDV